MYIHIISIIIFYETYQGIFNRSWEAYCDWKDNPILTSVKTTGLPLSDIKYPAIILCSQGVNPEVSKRAFIGQSLRYLQEKGTDDLVSLAEAIKKTDSIDLIYNIDYLTKYFPGLDYPNEDPYEAINLMLSKNPESLIKANVAANGGFDPCSDQG